MIEPFAKPIYVAKPFLPPLEEFADGLKEIWDNAWLTNNGPLLQRYAKELESYFNSRNICLFNNGTLALQLGLQGMQISGEVITTPFTFVATTHSLYWNNIRPVFVDIEPDHYTLDPEKIEAAITPRTTAILAVHVFGHPCRLDALADIARRHKLKLIYDAAHAFGVSVNGKSIAHYGDLSMFSFHATKSYHSIEGGMLVFPDAGLKKTFDYLKNFGFENELEVVIPGTNAKMNEFQALMGMQVLKHMSAVGAKLYAIAAVYRKRLSLIPGIKLPPALPEGVTHNYSYVPIEVLPVFPISRDGLYDRLKTYNVFSRRYFYPLVTDFPCYRDLTITDPLTVARGVASRILTLPIYHDLPIKDVNRICKIIESLAPQK